MIRRQDPTPDVSLSAHPRTPDGAGPLLPPTLDAAIARATARLRVAQHPDGHWLFGVEADATIPAEFVILRHALGRPDAAREAGIGRHLRATQGADGGWPLFAGGPAEVSCTTKAYLALRLIGDPAEAAHMQRARAAVLALGGAEAANVFTRVTLAQFGAVPWRAVPAMPLALLLLPRRGPLHLGRSAYWARTVLVPLLVVAARQAVAANPAGVRIPELFHRVPQAVPGLVDRMLRGLGALTPRWLARRAERRALRFVSARLNGEDGLGGIFPAMANAALMLQLLGLSPDDCLTAIDGLVTEHDGLVDIAPCLSPVWDTALACHALLEAGEAAAAVAGLRWLLPRQVTGLAGDWAAARPGLAPGGWAFQYANPHFPDLDDTAAVALALDRAARDGLLRPEEVARPLDLAEGWVRGMRTATGGWAAFDAETGPDWLNDVPFADHCALVDPPTADVTARCLALLAARGARPADGDVEAAIAFLLRAQEPDGSWFGRWGVNYVYGTWCAVTGLVEAGLPRGHAALARAVAWLEARQNDDGGWGEDPLSYERPEAGPAASTPSQTSWAMLTLLAVVSPDRPSVARAADFLLARQLPDGGWAEDATTGTGFPRVFYLRYRAYPIVFPLWALARLRKLRRGAPRGS